MAAREDVIGGFLAASGASVDDLRGAGSSPALLVAVLDHLMADDAWVVACCDEQGWPYDAPMRARAALPGGESVHWT